MRLALELAASLWTFASSLVPTGQTGQNGAGTPGVPARPPSPKGLLSEDTRAYIADLRARWGVPGASIAVVTSPAYNASGAWADEVLCLGVADGQGTRVDADSLFAIASNSKLFTAAAVGLLIDNKTVLPNGAYLDWDTKIRDILPPDEWMLMDAYASDHVDITDLASMRSGMPSHNLAHGDIPAVHNVKLMRHLRPTAEIRQVWQYNNQHYYTLAHIVSKLSGMDFPAYVRAHILAPLNMTRTTYNATEAKAWGGRTDGFLHYGTNATQCARESTSARNISAACTGEARPVGWWTTGDCVSEAGPGGVVSCARDATKWLRELLEPRILPPALLPKLAQPIMHTGVPATSPDISAGAYGMAQFSLSYRGHALVFHTGGLPGQASVVLRAPDAGVALSVYTNDENFLSPFYYAAAYRILDDLLGLDSDGRVEQALFDESVSYAPAPKLRGDTPPPAHVLGSYFDEGYGRLDVSRLCDNSTLRAHVLPLLAYHRVPADRPLFVARFHRLFTDFLLFTHANASTWHAAVAKVHWYDRERGQVDPPPDALARLLSCSRNDQGNGTQGNNNGRNANSTAANAHLNPNVNAKPIVAAFGTALAVVTRDGIGMFGGFSAPGPRARLHPPTEEDVQANAEVWFKRQRHKMA